MKVKRLNPECINCLLDRHLNYFANECDEDVRINYMQNVLKIISNAKYFESAPELVEKLVTLQKEFFGTTTDYSETKSYFNKLMLGIEDELETKIYQSDFPLKTALKLALAGNYIDFGAMKNVDEAVLNDTLSTAISAEINETEFENLKNELKSSKSLVYITDNCGEIVLDKLFIKTIKAYNPNINVNVIVRGEAVLNDCTIEDAVEVQMHKIADVLSNGTAIAGTCLNRISVDAKDLIDRAEIIISKGQGNFESLRYSNKNIYYLFLCKCNLFVKKFNVKHLTGIFTNDLRMK